MDKKQKLTFSHIERIMDDSYSLCEVSPEENLYGQLSVIGECIDAGSAVPLSEAADEWYEDIRRDAAGRMLTRLKRDCKDGGFDEIEINEVFEEYDDSIRMAIYDRDESNPVLVLLKNTDDIPVRIEMVSDYDCINSHWLESIAGYSYENSYFGHLADALNLNPRKVKETLHANGERTAGRYPDIWIRNGREQVSYDDFCRELQNSCCGANLLTYIGRMNLKELYDSDFKIASVVVPKENSCGLFSAMQGGGSTMEMELQMDVTIDLKIDGYNGFRLRIDVCDAYPLKSVYGACDSFFGRKIRIINS